MPLFYHSLYVYFVATEDSISATHKGESVVSYTLVYDELHIATDLKKYDSHSPKAITSQ